MKKNDRINKILKWSFHLVLTVCIFDLSFLTYKKSTPRNLWKNHRQVNNKEMNNRGRTPSSKTLMDDSPQSVSLLKEYFQYNSFNKYVTFNFDINIRTENQNHNLKKIKDILKESLKKQLLPISPDSMSLNEYIQGPIFREILTSFSEGNLIINFLDYFSFKLKENNIEKGSLQIDFNFSPQITREFSYKKELSSNKLLKWKKLSSHSLKTSQSPLSLPQKVKNVIMPISNDPYQYIGGQISLWINLSQSEDQREEGPKKEEKRSTLRFRKYFQRNKGPQSFSFQQAPSFSITKAYIHKIFSKERRNFITVDIFKELYKNHSFFKLNKVEFNFGKLLSDSFYKKMPSRYPLSQREESIKSGDFIFEGIIKIKGHDHQFKTAIEKLIFDFNDGRFSMDSKLKTQTIQRKLPPSQEGSFQQKVNRQILDDRALDLIRALDLGQIFQFIKEGPLE